MKKILISLGAVTALMLGGVASATASAADVPGLTITQVGYNAYGSDTIFNRNQEYVDIRNNGGSDVNVKNLVVADQWAKSHEGDNPRGCNTWKVTSLPGITTGGDGSVMLPASHVVRVYSGRGVPSVSGGGTVHAVYMNSRCGYHGHIWGNGGDTAWITLGGDSESFAYDFDNGYVVKS